MDIKPYMVFDTWARETRFFDTIEEATEDLETCLEEIQGKEAEGIGEKVLLLEVIKKAEIVKTIKYD